MRERIHEREKKNERKKEEGVLKEEGVGTHSDKEKLASLGQLVLSISHTVQLEWCLTCTPGHNRTHL